MSTARSFRVKCWSSPLGLLLPLLLLPLMLLILDTFAADTTIDSSVTHWHNECHPLTQRLTAVSLTDTMSVTHWHNDWQQCHPLTQWLTAVSPTDTTIDSSVTHWRRRQLAPVQVVSNLRSIGTTCRHQLTCMLGHSPEWLVLRVGKGGGVT